MKLSDNAFNFIASHEGEGDGDKKTPGLQPYLCPANVWTIGFGHAIYFQGRRLEGEKDRELAYKLFPGLTREQALDLLHEDADKCAKAVLELLAGAPVTQNQFDAMGSLIFNIGKGNFAKSSVLRYHRRGLTKPSNLSLPALERASQNKSPPPNAPDQFVAWSYIKGGTVWTRGLFKRRILERQRYLQSW